MEIDEDTKTDIHQMASHMSELVELKGKIEMVIDTQIIAIKIDGLAILKAANINHDTLPKHSCEHDSLADIVYAWWL